jgi:hypothetical protein
MIVSSRKYFFSLPVQVISRRKNTLSAAGTKRLYLKRFRLRQRKYQRYGPDFFSHSRTAGFIYCMAEWNFISGDIKQATRNS